MADAIGLGGLHNVSGLCDYCAEPCDPAQELNALTCTYADCPDLVYHQSCIEQHLKKIRLEKNRKTGFQCPRGRGKGSTHTVPCPGRIDKSHPIHPRNDGGKKRRKGKTPEAVPVTKAAPTKKTKDKKEEEEVKRATEKSEDQPKLQSSKSAVITIRNLGNPNLGVHPLLPSSSSSSAILPPRGPSKPASAVDKQREVKEALRRELGVGSEGAPPTTSSAGPRLTPASSELKTLEEYEAERQSSSSFFREAAAPVNAWNCKPAALALQAGASGSTSREVPSISSADAFPPPAAAAWRGAGQEKDGDAPTPAAPALPQPSQVRAQLQGAWARPGSQPELSASGIASGSSGGWGGGVAGASSSVASLPASLQHSSDKSEAGRLGLGPWGADAADSSHLGEGSVASGGLDAGSSHGDAPFASSAAAEAKLTRAQKKNLKRAEKKRKQQLSTGESLAADDSVDSNLAGPDDSLRGLGQRSEPLPGAAEQSGAAAQAAVQPPPPPPPMTLRQAEGAGPGRSSGPASGGDPPAHQPALPHQPPSSKDSAPLPPRGRSHSSPAAPAPPPPSRGGAAGLSPSASNGKPQWSPMSSAPAKPIPDHSVFQGDPMFATCLKSIVRNKVLGTIRSLVKLGFPDWASVAAVQRHGTSLQECIAWLLETPLDSEADLQSHPIAAAPHVDVEEDIHVLRQVAEWLQLSLEAMEQSVIDCDGDVLEAMRLVIEHAGCQPPETAREPTKPPSRPAVKQASVLRSAANSSSSLSVASVASSGASGAPPSHSAASEPPADATAADRKQAEGPAPRPADGAGQKARSAAATAPLADPVVTGPPGFQDRTPGPSLVEAGLRLCSVSKEADRIVRAPNLKRDDSLGPIGRAVSSVAGNPAVLSGRDLAAPAAEDAASLHVQRGSSSAAGGGGGAGADEPQPAKLAAGLRGSRLLSWMQPQQPLPPHQAGGPVAATAGQRDSVAAGSDAARLGAPQNAPAHLGEGGRYPTGAPPGWQQTRPIFSLLQTLNASQPLQKAPPGMPPPPHHGADAAMLYPRDLPGLAVQPNNRPLEAAVPGMPARGREAASYWPMASHSGASAAAAGLRSAAAAHDPLAAGATPLPRHPLSRPPPGGFAADARVLPGGGAGAAARPPPPGFSLLSNQRAGSAILDLIRPSGSRAAAASNADAALGSSRATAEASLSGILGRPEAARADSTGAPGVGMAGQPLRGSFPAHSRPNEPHTVGEMVYSGAPAAALFAAAAVTSEPLQDEDLHKLIDGAGW